MRIGFKEWAVVVDALGRGDQILILRKGGISEGPGGFTLEHSRFALFPTRFHQQRDLVRPDAQARYDQIAASFSDTIVTIEYFADVVDWKVLRSADDAVRLEGQHIWRPEVVQERLERGKQELYALAVRVSRFRHPIQLPIVPQYGGCKSWVDFAEPLDATHAEPVLTEAEFASKLAEFESALDPSAFHPGSANSSNKSTPLSYERVS